MTPRKRPRQTDQGAVRREKILEVTFQHLVRNGFEGLRVREVARDAGIHQATLLYHFQDKEALILALVDDLVERMRAFNASDQPPKIGSFDGFDGHLRTLCKLFASDTGIYVAFNEIALRAMRDERIARKLAGVEADWQDHVESLLRAAAPACRAQVIRELACASIVFVRGVAARSAGNGTLAALLRDRAAGDGAMRQLRTSFDTFIELVHTRLQA